MSFEIPVALIIFKRNKAVEIVRKIAQVKPAKIYLLGDQGRNQEEIAAVEECRRNVENAIDWECEVIKHYAEKNIGVYGNIAGGAEWVLSREKEAIFLEDDNLPQTSFFYYCREMLERYKNDSRVLWVCGTNYLGQYSPKSDASYVFTRHMLPCGWATWSDKFLKYYDGTLALCDDADVVERASQFYCNKKVYQQYKRAWLGEYERIQKGKRPISWDYQMDLTLKAHGLLGICPCVNQIRNIGVDADSIHGGYSLTQEMTRRFCGVESYELTFPLKHPRTVIPDPVFEKKIGQIILYPLKQRVIGHVSRTIKRIFKIPKEKKLSRIFRGE